MSTLPEIDLNDPGYLRHCLRPGCTASFNIAEQMGDGPYVHGWHWVGMFGGACLCPPHSRQLLYGTHRPSWLRDGDEISGVGCSCGWSWEPGHPATIGEHRDQWVAHLVRVDP